MPKLFSWLIKHSNFYAGEITQRKQTMPESKEEKIRRLNQELENFIAAEVAKSQEKTGDEKSFEEILQVY